MAVSITFAEITVPVRCRALAGEERLGEGFELTAVLEAPEPLDGAAALGKAVLVELQTPHGERHIAGIVARWTAIATTRLDGTRGYRALIRPTLRHLELKRRSRVYRKITAPAIVEKLLEEGGYAAAPPNLQAGHPEREYTVQYEESDATFLRRMCEDDGLYLRFHADGGREGVAIEDDSRAATAALEVPLTLVDDRDLLGTEPAAFHARARRRLRPGKVVLSDYDEKHPSVDMRATAQAEDASDVEREAAVYRAPGGYRERGAADVRARYDREGKVAGADALAGSGEARAILALEAARADARAIEVESNVMGLAPGKAFTLEPAAPHAGVPSGDHVVVAVRHDYRFDAERHTVHVTAIPRTVPFRLPRVTPKPRIAGLQTAITTGASGEEIHTDELGNAFVRHLWDIDAPTDHTSSKAVRTMQPNMPDSMLLPRVGWEVLTAFEDGDPERPFVLGRSYTSKMMPPFALPANKTVTSFATDSSPGAGGRNSIHIDDAAGREHLKIQATFDRDIKVGDKMATQTGNNERYSVTGNLSMMVGAQQSLTVGQGLFASLGSLTWKVGLFQKIGVGGDFGSRVGNEVVIVGAAQVEQSGNPVRGAVNLAMNKALQVIGAKGLTGAVVAAGLGVGKAAVEGYIRGGPDAALEAASMGAMGVGAGLIPGGEAAMSYLTGSTSPNPWDHGDAAASAAAPGGGAGAGSSDSAAAAGPGPGHRIITARGFGLEVARGFRVATPGQVGWTTAGAAVTVTTGSKLSKAASGTNRCLGLSGELLGSRKVTTKEKLNRKSLVRAAVKTSGPLDIHAKTKYVFQSAMARIVCGDTLTLGPEVTFKCGGSSITANSSGLTLESDKIEITGEYKQSAGLAHL